MELMTPDTRKTILHQTVTDVAIEGGRALKMDITDVLEVLVASVATLAVNTAKKGLRREAVIAAAELLLAYAHKNHPLVQGSDELVEH
ncbi:hypothetical protein UFOVP32_64 [uncultured Caudovirales phage]|uniref:Uncharacterized protein n=1 Tax=uncultured Caudovirales phage TaxID=2100421 RepID=A0A6J5KRR4_9CAUD|nr:hypothetical protein UFOVP32_64 [uncultured Caudovirales phage]CAB4123559.1 hypothetical protein UFOVP50_12 [uncultured Caudovirales phage]